MINFLKALLPNSAYDVCIGEGTRCSVSGIDRRIVTPFGKFFKRFKERSSIPPGKIVPSVTRCEKSVAAHKLISAVVAY